ncbi:hypothetical protein LGH70_17155 [Hymenobacter sp. BT635]|uniref:DUF1682 domain-containing protein n=1 Tax=Hymenobacter nitidus TaxID=2880929 RepID=A0ABS8AK19_9BACT|nr:hypothetical protein [Hymenobacter nitidus]MCB2379329.1 hypothetical protein [Hymenobacter nitidus]
MNRKFWLLRGLKIAFLGALFILVMGFGTRALWNWLVPELFHGPFISFWQALGLLLLTRLLTGFRGGGGRPNFSRKWQKHKNDWKQRMETRMASMTPEEQEKFRQKMRASCGPPWMRRGAEPAPTTATE